MSIEARPSPLVPKHEYFEEFGKKYLVVELQGGRAAVRDENGQETEYGRRLRMSLSTIPGVVLGLDSIQYEAGRVKLSLSDKSAVPQILNEVKRPVKIEIRPPKNSTEG